ncbi:MAG: RIP metalloprotease RseP [Flavobacteriales bacterium]|nr:RIP metalloprotease RseP [Flavobacteriales bacterium]
MEMFIKISQFILSLSILVVLHELGHFIPAKLFKTRVEKFYLFFDPWISLFKIKMGGTEYGIGWLPLGGYVKIAGMIDESMDKEQLKKPVQPWEFRAKPAWQRLIIMLGGVSVNLVLSVVIYWMISFVDGTTYLPNDSLKDGVWCQHEIALEIGFKNGDKLISVDGEEDQRFFRLLSQLHVGKTVEIERDGIRKTINLPIDLLGQISTSDMRGGLLSYRIPFFISQVVEGSGASKSGIQIKDKIVGLDGQPIKYFDEFKDGVKNRGGETVHVTVERDTELIELDITLSEEGIAGIAPAGLGLRELEKLGIYKLDAQQYGFFEAFPVGLNEAKETLGDYLNGLKQFANPDTGAYKGVGGIIAMLNIFPNDWDWLRFWRLTAFLSLMLAVMNLLPIPALDGGHVVFLIYEMITQRKPNEKFMEYAQLAGMVMILILMLFANGNDVIKMLP